MSYQFAEVKLHNVQKLVGIGETNYIDLSPINGNDASFLRVAVIVSAWSTGPVNLSIQHSHDGGQSWVTAPALTTAPITAIGTWTVETTPTTGPLSPNVRLAIISNGGGVGISRVSKTFSPGPVIITAAASGGASEATAAAILAAVDTVETKLDAINTSIGTLPADVGTIKADTALIKADVGTIKTDVGSVKTNTDTLVTSNAAVKTNTDTLVTDTAAIKADVATIKADTATIKADVALVKADTGTLVTSNAAVKVATEAINTKTPALGQALSAASVPVVLPSDMPALNTKATRTVANPAVVRSYVAASISDAAWTEIIASTAQAITLLKIFDSSGQIIKVGTGVALSEADLIRIPPGGDNFEVSIPAGTRIAIRAEAGVGTVVVGTLIFQMFT